MKIYRVSRPYLWAVTGAKFVLTLLATFAYAFAVTHPTPLPFRLLLLAGIALLILKLYVRWPKMPTEIELTSDGWVHFKGRKATTRVHVASIRSIGQNLGRRTVRLRHGGGKVQMPNRFRGFYDFIATVKSLNPAIEVRGF